MWRYVHVALGTPKAEVDIDSELVATLIADQAPHYAELAVTPLESGWDNALFRVGERWVARLPRRQEAAQLVLHEQRWLPEVAAGLPVPIPVPEFAGRPGGSYPWSWSLTPWFAGHAACREWPRAAEVDRFVAFLQSLHRQAPDDAPRNPYRGVALQSRAADTEARMQKLSVVPGAPELLNAAAPLWRDALVAPFVDHPTWLHGDLHARNVVVRDGQLAAVIDWGDICRGDPATDLASVWALFESAEARHRAVQLYNAPDPDVWRRARGWAVFFGVILWATGHVDNPEHASMGRATLERLAEDAAVGE